MEFVKGTGGAWEEGLQSWSQCKYCRRAVAPRLTTTLTCEAFPAGIPTPILMNQYDHRYPFPGDTGMSGEDNPKSILFEPKDAAADSEMTKLFGIGPRRE